MVVFPTWIKNNPQKLQLSVRRVENIIYELYVVHSQLRTASAQQAICIHVHT